MTDSSFIHLHLHSAYSLAEGAIRVKDLVKLCVKQGMPAVAITDTNNMFGAMEFALEAVKSGLQPIVGCQIDLEGGGQLVLLVQSGQGWLNLSRLISESYMGSDPAAGLSVSWETLHSCAEGIICLTGGPKGPAQTDLLAGRREEAGAVLARLKDIFAGRLYVELQRHGWREEDATEDLLIDLAYELDLPLVATNDCYFARREMHEAHDALLCIAEGRYISEDDRRRVTPEHYFKSASEMRELFKDIPEAIDNTLVIARRCHYILKPVDPILPPFDTEGGRSEVEEMKDQARKGLDWRLENFVYTKDMDEAARTETRKTYLERLEYELDIIVQMGFPGYFLIVSDFIKWSKDHRIPVGPGRGSGAGSVVAWALKITDLDPLRFNLLFERFLNPERVSMPDFDVDFCQERRDEVIRYVQDKYGHDKVAQIITFGKLQARAVVRDVGRVLQMSYGQVDRIAKMIPNNPANPMTLEEALQQDPDLRAERRRDETTDKLITIALQLEGLYRHASTHAAGVVIGDRPLHELVPLYRDPRSDMPVTQFNMKFVELTGLVKFDFLGLKTMTVIQKAIDMIAEKGPDIDFLQIPFDDEKTYDLLTEGRTVGVFQVESAGMRDTLRRMKPNRLEDIIALVALYRPGPMDNIPRYIDIKEEREEPDYMHDKLVPYLTETYGIMIYQEQVMQAAQALAGYSLGGADLLRRAMGKKIKEAMDAEREKFVAGAKKCNDIDAGKANEIFDAIAKFAGYGFNKSHAAAYAVISYWTGWLKANYPVEFMAASMTLDLGNTDKLSVFKQDLDKMKIPLFPPDINMSNVVFKVEGEAIRYALAALKGVGEQAMTLLVNERKANGKYAGLDDLAARLDPKSMNRRQMEQLACAGAFDSVNDNRAQVHAAAEMILRHVHTLSDEKASGQVSLFGGGDNSISNLPSLPDVPMWDPLEKLRREFEAVGFYLSAHPLDTRREQLERLDIKNMAEVEHALLDRHSGRFQMAGVLLKKQEKLSQKGNKYAFLQLSDSSGVYEITLFSELLAAARAFLEPGETLWLEVDAEQREDQVRYTAQKIELLDKALEGKVRKVRITINDPAPLSVLKTLLDQEGKGQARVMILVRTDPDTEAEITLPGLWRFRAEARNALLKTQGITEVREI